MKRLLACLMSVVLAVGLMPAGAWAAQGDSGETASGLFAVSSAALVADSKPDDASARSGSSQVTALDPQRIGIGGGGALFDPAISPFDANDMAIGTDMGDVYVTRDGGGTWAKKSVGLAYDIQYDPVREGTVYVCGSGIWHSTDYGENFELMWPKAEHVTGTPMKYEDFRHYLFNADGYNQASQIVSMAIDRKAGNVMYALASQTRYNQDWEGQATELVLHRSSDGGGTFEKLAAMDIGPVGLDRFYDKSKVLVNDGTAWVCTTAGIYAYAEGQGELQPVYEPDGETRFSIFDVVQAESDGSQGVEEGTYYWMAEDLEGGNSVDPRSSLRRFHVGSGGQLEFEDLTDDMNNSEKGLNRTVKGTTDDVPMSIYELAAPSATRVYFTVRADYAAYDARNSDTVRSVNGMNSTGVLLARYDGSPGADKPFKWVLGHQVRDRVQLNDDVPGRMELLNQGYCEGYLLMYGIAASPAAPNGFLLGGGAGAYGTLDCEVANPKQSDNYPQTSNIRQLYSNRHPNAAVDAYGGYDNDGAASADEADKLTLSSTGIDNVTTYGVREDPFDANHVAILHTDQNLVLSNDGGTSWSTRKTSDNRDWGGTRTGAWSRVPPSWSNTIYDLVFDPYVEGRMYGLWSGRHDAPYQTYESDKSAKGGFAVANMTEDNWESLIVNWRKADGSALCDDAGNATDAALPANSIPVRMSVVYPTDPAARADGAGRTFWVACFGKGFYRSDDSGNSFKAVNGGVADQSDGLIYAADVEASEDGGRVFGMTARRTDDSGVGGRVYRYDGEGEAWVEIPLLGAEDGDELRRAMCPRDIYWDEARDTLYISCVAANSQKNARTGYPDFYNHHGGIYVWHPGDERAVPLDAESDAVGDASSIEGVAVDGSGNLFASDARGNIWLRRAGMQSFEKVYSQFHVTSKNVQLLSESVSGGVRTDTIVLPSFGGGTLKMDVSIAEKPEANPEAVTGATAPANEAEREKVYVESYRNRDYSHYYGPQYELDEEDADAAVIETAMKAAEHKMLVFEAGRTYKIGTYVRSNVGGIWGRSQGVHLTTSDVVIDGNGATIEWDDGDVFVGNDGFVLEGTMENPIHDIVIRDLNFTSVNCSRNWDDPVTQKTYKNNNLVQLKGLSCENVLVENCTFDALPNPSPSLHQRSDEEGRGISNIWFYAGAKNITVRGCTMHDVTCGSQESGSNLLFSGECEWKRNKEKSAAQGDRDFLNEYNAATAERQYQMICDQHLQGSVENILVEDNAFEHACHDESVSLWCAEVFKDILIRDNTFNVHDKDAHVPSTVNFTFGTPDHHDRFENFVFDHNDVFGQASWALLVPRADMGGDLHFTNNKLHFDRVKLDRQRVPTYDSGGDLAGYAYSTKTDIQGTNGLLYAALNRDYVDFSGNVVTYSNTDGGKGLMNLMGAKNILCDGNRFTANGPLSYLAVLWASEVTDAAGHETVFTNNTFKLNGLLDKALLRGGFRFTGNTVQLNGTVTGSSLFNISGNVESKTENDVTTKTNRLYTLPGDVTFSGNTITANTTLPQNMAGLLVYDASFAGHEVDFTGNKFESTVDQPRGDFWPLADLRDMQGPTPVVNAAGTMGNLFNGLSFYRTSESDSGYRDLQGTLVDPKVLFDGHQEFTPERDHQTKHMLSVGGLAWGEPTYEWSSGNAACTARRTCSDKPGRAVVETVAVVPEVTRAATCAQRGETTYTAAFSEDCFAVQTKVADDIAQTPHAWDAGRVTQEATAASEGVRTYTCTACGATRTEPVPKAAVAPSPKPGSEVAPSPKPGSGAAPAPDPAPDPAAKAAVRATKLTKLKAAKRGFKAKWAKVSRASGYQLQYGPKKSFKGAKKVTLKGAKATSRKVGKLKAKKKYWVRVRAYAKSGGKTHYSAWSKAKPVKTK